MRNKERLNNYCYKTMPKQDKLCPNYVDKGIRNKSETDFSKCNEKIKL